MARRPRGAGLSGIRLALVEHRRRFVDRFPTAQGCQRVADTEAGAATQATGSELFCALWAVDESAAARFTAAGLERYYALTERDELVELD